MKIADATPHTWTLLQPRTLEDRVGVAAREVRSGAPPARLRRGRPYSRSRTTSEPSVAATTRMAICLRSHGSARI